MQGKKELRNVHFILNTCCQFQFQREAILRCYFKKILIFLQNQFVFKMYQTEGYYTARVTITFNRKWANTDLIEEYPAHSFKFTNIGILWEKLDSFTLISKGTQASGGQRISFRCDTKFIINWVWNNLLSYLTPNLLLFSWSAFQRIRVPDSCCLFEKASNPLVK